MDEAVNINVPVNSCLQCPFFEKKPVSHFLIDPGMGFEYICRKSKKNIMPSDGVKPPPKWCEFREVPPWD